MSIEFHGDEHQERVRDALRAAVEQVLHEHGELPTKWILTAEAMGADGERSFWLTASDGAKPWDVLGMIGFADALTRDAIGRREN